MRPVVFLDRDGTLNIEVGYIKDIANLNLIEGAAAAIKTLNQNGIAAILVTNQTGAARGYYPEEHIQALHKRLTNLLAAEGAYLDKIYYCPHYEDGIVSSLSFDCQCRKPKCGMIEKAYAEIPDIDRGRSYVIGDKSTDVELAQNCGAKGILVTTGYGKQVLDGTYQWPVQPDFTANDIGSAVHWLMNDLGLKISGAPAKVD